MKKQTLSHSMSVRFVGSRRSTWHTPRSLQQGICTTTLQVHYIGFRQSRPTADVKNHSQSVARITAILH
jgi:hypothetical protein